MLFCVTTRGRDSIFSSPRDSAIVKMASRRTLLLALMKLRPLVGPFAARFENSGICTPLLLLPPPTTGYIGFGVFPTVKGEVPTDVDPPTPEGLFPQPNPNCVPISR